MYKFILFLSVCAGRGEEGLFGAGGQLGAGVRPRQVVQLPDAVQGVIHLHNLVSFCMFVCLSIQYLSVCLSLCIFVNEILFHDTHFCHLWSVYTFLCKCVCLTSLSVN